MFSYNDLIWESIEVFNLMQGFGFWVWVSDMVAASQIGYSTKNCNPKRSIILLYLISYN